MAHGYGCKYKNPIYASTEFLKSLKAMSNICSAVCSHPAYCFVLYCTECDDTRCCDNTICPPEDGHVDARNMSRVVM
jgi:hypothetical protein